MKMLPSVEGSLLKDIKEVTQPSKTYRLDIENHRVIGYCTGIDAIKQAVYKVLNSERFQYLIYSWNYGVEINYLIGKSRTYVQSQLKRVIEEALIQDDRIIGVDQYSFELFPKSIHVTFKVNTVYGTLNMEKEVNV